MPSAITVGRNTLRVRTDRQTDGAQKSTIALNRHKSHFGGNNTLGGGGKERKKKKKEGIS